MGCSEHTYLGPYMVINKKTIIIESLTYTCPKSDCKRFNTVLKANFCPECGSPKKEEKKNKEVKRGFDFDLIYELHIHEDLFFHPEFIEKEEEEENEENESIILPNNIRGAKWNKKTKSISNIRPTLELELFEKLYNSELIIIREYFGKENVKLKWGLISYTC